MGEVVNLRRVRKAKKRTADVAVADANRLQFGRTRAERQETAMRQARVERMLDGHRREPPEDDA